MSDPAADGGDDRPDVHDARAAGERYGGLLEERLGQTILFVERERYLAAAKAITDDGFSMCVDLTAVDYLQHPGRWVPEGVVAERFELVVNFLDLAGRRRLRVRVQVPADDPTVPTLFDLHPGTEALEREVYDMFGITFTDHPDMTRILMPEDWEGHPLRKDYAVGTIPVQFKGTPN